MNEPLPATPPAPTQETVSPAKKGSWKIWLVLLVVIACCASAFVWWRVEPATQNYVTASVSSGDIVQTIITTGTVNPVTTVQVGSYVSGTVESLSCDYNTKVTAGQLCAKIDPRPYQVVYDQAAANLASAQAQLMKDQANLTYAKLNYARNTALQKKGIVSQESLESDKNTLDQASAQVGVDEATIKQREAALDAAKVNLDYTNIISPVDGTVISRSIDVGQTVASSFQTPTLFLIAKDLTQMQVDTSVSESDVGNAKLGQKALFTVEAYPNKIFEGKVKQVRQAPITVQNVVTYNVVIGVDNPDFLLLPGMTANTRIIADQHENVLHVPVQALRFSLKKGETGDVKSQRIYVLEDGIPRRVPVTVGLTDGTNTEISADGLKAGDAVIVNNVKPPEATKMTKPTSPPIRF